MSLSTDATSSSPHDAFAARDLESLRNQIEQIARETRKFLSNDCWELGGERIRAPRVNALNDTWAHMHNHIVRMRATISDSGKIDPLIALLVDEYPLMDADVLREQFEQADGIIETMKSHCADSISNIPHRIETSVDATPDSAWLRDTTEFAEKFLQWIEDVAPYYRDTQKVARPFIHTAKKPILDVAFTL